MEIKTSKKKTYNVAWIDQPVQNENRLVFTLIDDLKMADIVREFSGLDWIERFSEEQGNVIFEGFKAIAAISKNANGTTLVVLEKD